MSLQYVPDVIYDAGHTEYGELIKSLLLKTEALISGQIIEVISNEPSVKEDLLTWVRIQKHTLLDRKDFGESCYYYIEKR
ncbi:sulfurtransferase TusA family protein [Bacillus sp. EB106-08-02-XG196]|uniref:sulfurtransferase TusA family protein n=1 Tax=Bacillus sp. EB106-08-02-XG196 TaxID=2737049 RepID=UPI0015C473F3|nr:sulfurtransferase TusA family protein [Bacillus sp. EB106-08-02-XG196]NWQ39080.1 sulfurtransferase TusA family protein [Bacillus sp. EB106-08-02-XG196]